MPARLSDPNPAFAAAEAPLSPLSTIARAVVWVGAMVLSCGIAAQTSPSAAPALGPVAAAEADALDAMTVSRLDAPLFYQLLIGEIELQRGEAGTAYEVVIDAARKAKDETLFRRATDIALQARAGDQALAAVQAWRTAVPASVEAHRYLIQLLVALNRTAETAEPLRAFLTITPAMQRPVVIANLPRFFARVGDRNAAAQVLDEVLQPYAADPATRTDAQVAMGRAWVVAGNTARALELANAAQAQDPASDAPALLALELMPTTPAAEAIVLQRLQAAPPGNGNGNGNGVRLVYARALTVAQRYADAIVQLDVVTRNEPTLAPPWITLGALHLELRQPERAEAALQKYVALMQSAPASSASLPAGHAAVDGADDDDAAPNADMGLTQAWLMLAQAAEQRRDFKAAEAWLAKVDNPTRALEVQSRRASILARQGMMKEARALIRKAPERSKEDARAKLLGEVQLLRDAKLWSEAAQVLAEANQRFPDDVDLIYEQSMMEEKLNRLEKMETLLRRVIVLKPDHQHAHNALGYSLAERNLRLPEAKALIQKALELAPGDPFITDSLGWVEFRLGNRDEAVRLLRGAYNARPDPEIATHLGEVLWVNGQREEAMRVWREARLRDSTNDVLRETLARLKVDL